jgi:aspartokinase-like uncharacterized kinase
MTAAQLRHWLDRGDSLHSTTEYVRGYVDAMHQTALLLAASGQGTASEHVLDVAETKSRELNAVLVDYGHISLFDQAVGIVRTAALEVIGR